MTQALTFTLRRWAAWSPAQQTADDWQQWALGNSELVNDDSSPALKFIKPMQRRRFSRLSRMALQVAYDCAQDDHSLRTVFASRHGEIHRTKALLDDIVQSEPISPMGFSLSVHNTGSGLYSIASGNRAPSTAIAAGRDSLEAALIDALGQLRQDASAPVLVVLADEPLPEFYAADDNEQLVPYALALLIEPGTAAGQSFTLSRQSGSQSSDASNHGLALIKLLCGAESECLLTGERCSWKWQRGE
jgi:hypothetical protein